MTDSIGLINNKKLSMMDFKIPTMAEMAANGDSPEILFWVGCAGSYDERAQRVTVALSKYCTM